MVESRPTEPVKRVGKTFSQASGDETSKTDPGSTPEILHESWRAMKTMLRALWGGGVDDGKYVLVCSASQLKSCRETTPRVLKAVMKFRC